MTQKQQPLRTRGGAWGPQRVKLGVSMRELEAATGIHRSVLSYAEGGRMVPTGAEYDKVMAFLREREDAIVDPLKSNEQATPV